jgi:cytochrome b561
VGSRGPLRGFVCRKPDKPAAALAHLTHFAGAWTLIVLVSVHALTALAHRFVRNDGVLESMTGGPPKRASI